MKRVRFILRQTALACLGVLVVALPITLVQLFKPESKIEAAWPSDNWAYRQIITVTNNGSAKTDYQVAVYINRMEMV